LVGLFVVFRRSGRRGELIDWGGIEWFMGVFKMVKEEDGA